MSWLEYSEFMGDSGVAYELVEGRTTADLQPRLLSYSSFKMDLRLPSSRGN